MANTIPVQVRAVDPFAEYNSNSVNRLTRITSKGTNCIISNDDINVIQDSTSPLTYAVVTSGSCIKDEMLISITSNFRVNFADADFYVNGAPPFNETGNYYLVIDYTYDKVRPAPQASIKILKPSQSSLLTSDYLLLKVVEVIYTGSAFNISSFYDYDPTDTDVKRICSDTFASLDSPLPTFDSTIHTGKIVYDTEMGIPYIGTVDGWKEFGTFDYQCNTSLCTVGQLVYIGANNTAYPAIASSVSTFATAVVLSVDSVKGRVRISGKITNGKPETGITINNGDTLYLSQTEAGSATNVLPSSGNIQVIGTCINISDGLYSTVLASLSGVEGNMAHNTLMGIQGGSSTERYHLTATQHANLGNGDHESLAGLLGGDGTYHYHVGQETFTNIGNGTHNQISGAQGGTNLERYHITLGIYNAINAFGGNHNNCPTGLQGGNSTERYHLSQTQYNNLGDGSHNGLSGLQGGSSSERYHLTASQYTNLVGFPSGTRLIFPQASAPTGWTQITTINDRVIRVTNGSGGGTGGSWTISGLSGGSHTHTTAGHTLTISEIPSHTHSISTTLVRRAGNANYIGGAYEGSNWTGNTDATGGGAAHDHGNTGSSTTTVNSDSSWRPAYLDVIVAEKS